MAEFFVLNQPDCNSLAGEDESHPGGCGFDSSSKKLIEPQKQPLFTATILRNRRHPNSALCIALVVIKENKWSFP